MSFKDWPYWLKGGVIGLIIVVITIFLFLLIMSFKAPLHNYNQAKEKYEDYNFVIKNCGNNPSDDCLKKLCGNRTDGFCEGVNSVYGFELEDWEFVRQNCASGDLNDDCLKRLCANNEFSTFCEKINKLNPPESRHGWRDYVNTEKPNPFSKRFLMPNLNDGFDNFIFFGGFVGLYIIITLILGFLIGWIYGKMKR